MFKKRKKPVTHECFTWNFEFNYIKDKNMTIAKHLRKRDVFERLSESFCIDSI